MSTISDRERLAKRRRLHLVSSHTGISHADLASGFIADGIYDNDPDSLLRASSIPNNYRPEMTSPASGNVLPLMLPEGTSLCLSSLHGRETHLGECRTNPPHSGLGQFPMDTPQAKIKSQSTGRMMSPFKDCVDNFGKFDSPRYLRPMDGQVNGYVKFNWPRIGERKVDHQATNGTDENIKTESYGGNGEETHRRKSSVASNHALSNYSSCHSAESSSTRVSGLVSGTPRSITPLSDLSPNLAISPMTPHSSSRIHVPTPKTQMTCFNGGMTAAPRKVPPNFGHHVAMDHIDRKFLTFYIQNWCPGRCILKDTNLWLTEFARMHDRESILAAIQCLAGTYIYDYKPQSIVRQRVNERFAVAESRLSYLLEHSAGLDRQDSMELVTLSSILSMQDIVLTERRSKLPYMPRWLQGFLQCERLLQATDLGHRFWKLENVQVDSLYNSLAVIVGRSVILAQPMMPLPAAATFDFSAEERRFGWLLYGSEKDMYEIHGGCGFSKRLLHFFSQVTYCAARLNQYRESAVVPTTAEYLYTGLMDLRQWSQQSTAWHAQREPPPIMWVREVSDDYVIQTPEEMTDITAEVWRIAGLLYLQCRLLRLPRNNPDVVGNLDDLAKCISIMPRSGFVFTAQAPLLPVFLLGLLATVPEHRAVAILWFEQVMQTPVRSSVPPLYDALKRILVWLPSEIKVPSTTTKCSAAIAERQAWWELMVSKVQKKEPEVLCLT